MKILTLLMASVLLFSACESKPDNDPASQPSIHSYSLKDTKGKTYEVKRTGTEISVVGHENKVIIFDIFATWCPGCKVIAPHLGNLQKKYPGNVLIIGLTIEREISNAQLDAFSAEHGASYPISNTKDNQLLAQRLAYDVRQPRSFGIPLVVMYGKNKKYFRHYLGPVAEEIMDRDIQSALGKK
jgi:thiol-disulfide isomerase/thioredoxin